MMVWRLTLEPRIVELLFMSNVRGFYSKAPIPVALRVCHESRNATQKLCPKFFGVYQRPGRICFNFDLDTVYLVMGQLHSFVGLINEQELQRLKYVAIDDGKRAVWTSCLAKVDTVRNTLSAIDRLRALIMVRDVTLSLRKSS
jgi:hypothetical protein